MAIDIKVPPMGESITEATVASWRKKAGDGVNVGDIVVELETDKVTMEVPAPSAGVLKEILKNTGETVRVNEVLARMEAGAVPAAAAAGAASPSTSPSAAAPAPSAPAQRNDTLPPAARRMVEENKVNVADVTGTGKRGQVTKADVVHHLEGKTSGTSSAAPARAPVPIRPARSAERESTVPMSRLRQKIAERLVQAQHTAAILTTFNEIDMTAVMELRTKFKEAFKERHGVGLGFMSFFARACVEALREYPAINAEIRGTDIIYKNYADIGVAVGGPKGLVVPIIRDADQKSFAEIEQEIVLLADKVRTGSISLAELEGGTFTISNGGTYGSLLSTPIINPPQSGILGMHAIQKRAVVVNDEIKIRPMMYVALSYDHRIVDGKEAVSFLVRVKQCIESPERMLLDV